VSENESEGLEESLVSSLTKSNLIEVGVDLAEVGLDQLLAQGALRDIPVFGTLLGLYRTFGVVRDRIFATKVIRFLAGLGGIPLEEREQFVKDYQKPEEKRRLGETLVLLLDRFDDMDKPEALSRLFGAYVRGQYDLETFRRLAAALDQIPLSAIGPLERFYQEPEYQPANYPPPRPGPYHSQFVAAGLINIEFSRTGPTGGPGGRYTKNELGELFLRILALPPAEKHKATSN
jgi:hypothetical protein